MQRVLTAAALKFSVETSCGAKEIILRTSFFCTKRCVKIHVVPLIFFRTDISIDTDP